MENLARLNNLSLVLTEQCNLRCPYCYVPKSGTTMPEEVALAAVRFLADRAPPEQPLTLSFFGGEPFLAQPLMERVMAEARALRPDRFRFVTPTNGTLLDDAALELVERHRLELALSLDGESASAARPDRRGRSSLECLRARFGELRSRSTIVRMTVTPDNVGQLFDNITSILSWGFRRIMHQPALEQPWPAGAVATWVEQHRRLADWACERYAEGKPLPDLTVLEGIIGRLCGRAAVYCGAGVTTAAVAPDGRLFGCYRSVYDPRAERLVLGHVLEGWTNETLLAAYARLDPVRALPEEGSCRGCEAREGCTCYCAAMGHVLLGDLRGVGRDACTLMRAQVAICRDLLERMRRLQRGRQRRVRAGVAAAALALGLSGAAGCDNDRGTVISDGSTDMAVQEMRAEGPVGGVCPVPPPDGLIDTMIPGLCDAPQPDMVGPGQCPWVPDAQAHDMMGPGVCPWVPDGMVPGPGLCPVPAPDQGNKPDDAGPPGPGLCPVPGLC
jgi:uncharacterized protein